jgi:NAD(P)-dependent dehydrogenase (short-subunit alcohol dehydrogenase family)
MSTGATYAVTGANRGLGLEFVRQLSTNNANNTIIAGVRSLKGELSDMEALASKSGNIHILECDTSSLSSIAAFGKNVTKTLGQDAQLDYLFNNAGINAVREQTALNLDGKDVQEHIAINVLGPAKTVEALLQHLGKGSVVMNMSSELGSCGKGKVMSATYSISKAALNMLTVHQAGELKEKGVKVICMDPGWVRTRMGGEEAMLGPEESISGMLKVVHGLQGTGKFYAYTGSEAPW